MNRILADTSTWVEMLRSKDSPTGGLLGRLLEEGLVCVHGLIRAEILSGARTPRQYRALEQGLSGLPLLEDPPGLWDRVAWSRYRLARQGFQASVADLIVAVSASYHRSPLFTLDRAFERIRDVLPLELFQTYQH